ncbi:MAG TPA: DUF2924 domain-containing protein [Pirellulales bacterium]
MSLNVEKEVAVLLLMTTKELRIRYAEVFGEETRANHRKWLQKRIIWRMQALAEGDLTERAKQRAAELANDADVRTTAPKGKPASEPTTNPAPANVVTSVLVVRGDSRVPPPGSVVTREYKGRHLRVMVLPNGFDFEGKVFRSLSAVAKAVTGQHCNGYHFFRLQKEKA